MDTWTSPVVGASQDEALASLTVRELIERLARTEEQLNLARLQSVDQEAGVVGHLLRRQRELIRELRGRAG